MSCCAAAPPTTKAEFLTAKLKNFRGFVEPYCTTAEQTAALQSYNSLDTVMPLLLQAVAAQRLGLGNELVDQFCAKFPASDDAFRVKVGRYLAMFCDVLST